MVRRKVPQFCVLAVGLSLLPGYFASSRTALAAEDAKNTGKQQVDTLNGEIKDKQSRVKELDGLIDKYRARIEEQEKQQSTLANDALILDNRIMAKTLDIERAKTELESTKLEIQSLEQQITDQNDRIGRQKTSAAELIRSINRADNVPVFEVLLSKPSLSSFFDRLEQDKKLQRDLTDVMDKVKGHKQTLEQTRRLLDGKRLTLEQKRKTLRKEQQELEAEKNFKISLASETQSKQSEYERVLYELNQQQQSTADEIAQLEEKLKDKLDDIDAALARGDVLFSWPLKPVRKITSHFHDPTYPFRHRFAHPGTDLRATVGTPVYAAAGGYVAWTKLGKAYGNYLMLVHPGNMATIYAHLSKFAVEPDTYVRRGDLIGYSGGMPGQKGAGLSTGPHLHFEVRQNGIPVNPENYLPTVIETDELEEE